jgi:hypothetical protein
MLALFTMEYSDDIAAKIWGPGITDTKYFQPAFLYQIVTKAGYRRPRSHYVRLVTFDPDKEPQWLQGDQCASRFFEARLLDAISEAHPAMVVLDEYFPEDDCLKPTLAAKQSDYTQMLRESIDRLSSKGIPVVIAEYSLNRDEQFEFIKKGKLDAGSKKLEDWENLLQPRLHFDGENGGHPLVTYGIAALDVDSRKIPISWPEYESQPELDVAKGGKDLAKSDHGPFEELGLAAQAAKVYDTSQAFSDQLDRLDARPENPFTSFLNEEEYIEFEAFDVMCGKQGAMIDKPQPDWTTCSHSSYAMGDLAGHIVLVGDSSEIDTHKSVLGDVHGLVLQANYIESLLDDRVLFPTPWQIEVLASLALFIAIDLTFRLTKSSLTALLLAISLVIFSYLVCYVIVLQFGYYMYVWVPSILALAGETLNRMIETKPRP